MELHQLSMNNLARAPLLTNPQPAPASPTEATASAPRATPASKAAHQAVLRAANVAVCRMKFRRLLRYFLSMLLQIGNKCFFSIYNFAGETKSTGFISVSMTSSTFAPGHQVSQSACWLLLEGAFSFISLSI